MENKSYQLRYLPLFEQDTLIKIHMSSKSIRFAAFFMERRFLYATIQ